jgi:DNA polymerase III subunit delta
MPPAKALHATEYLDAEDRQPPASVCVLFGDDSFLKRQVGRCLRRGVLGEDEADFSLTTFPGPTAMLADVLEELSTLAMFGSRRLVVVEEADEFVTRFRSELEDYVSRPKAKGVLALEVKSWPANTRLYKAVAATGLAIECTAPPGARLARWLVTWAKNVHHTKLSQPVAEQLVEMVGPELGLLDQELAKLALAATDAGQITSAMLQQLVGSWRAKTAWEMLDAALDGKTAEALTQLDRLILAGEHPVAILAQISASLRRLAAATRVILAAEASGRRVAVRDALAHAGVKGFVLEKSERQLRRLGRHRGGRLYRWLLEADMHLKGDSSLPPRTVLERLLVQISAPVPAIPAR